MFCAKKNDINDLVWEMTLAFGGAEGEPDEADFQAAECVMGRALNRTERQAMRRTWAASNAEAGAP